MAETRTFPAALRLRAHPPTEATVTVEILSAQGRAMRGAVVMLSALVAAPVLFIIPPHLPWGLGALALGAFLAWRQWSGRYLVREFQGTCPRCGRELEIRAGTRITLPHKVTCYECHHESELEMETPER